MKIAYGILCHTDAPHICRLAQKLTEGTENRVFIHVDLKTDIAPYRALMDGLERVTLLENRFDVRWAGYTSVEATIALMRAAVEDGSCYRFQLLQGLEYPLWTNAQIDAFYEQHRDTEFLKARNISTIHNLDEEHKYRLYWLWDQNRSPFFWCLNKFNMVLLRLKLVPHFKKNYLLDDSGRRMDYYQGSAQWGLTMAATKMVVEFHDRNPRFNQYFHTMYSSDESYFQTVIYNSEYAGHTLCGGPSPGTRLHDYMNLTFCVYEEEVKLFTAPEDYEFLHDTGFMFFRKAGSAGKALLDRIDRIHAGEE